AVAVALVLGTIAAASSPSVTIALMDELDAGGGGGPVARAVLGVSIVKDVLVIVLFTLVLAIAQPLTSAGTLDVSVAWTTLRRALGSLAGGAALGYAVSRFFRILGRDTPLFLVALAFLAAQVARLANLETMLIALAAGLVVRNVSPVEGERLRAELKRGALPVYIVFFALAGAGLRLDTLWAIWPWVLLLVALRALGLRLGTRWAGRGPSPVVPADLARHGWLGLVSQAGVTLGLAAAARRAFPEWGVSLEAVVVVMVGVHEIVGPICFRRALRLTGEVTEGEHVTEKADAGGPALVAGGGGV
ncbi:MAG: cation:proton antiporter, partial [Candidatus Rokuibacteriota bacterium]